MDLKQLMKNRRCFSLIGIVIWGALAGSMLPFIPRRAGLDPATSFAPFVAAVTPAQPDAMANCTSLTSSSPAAITK